MATLAHDGTSGRAPGRLAPVEPGSRLLSGLGFAVLSAASFGMSGALARQLLEAGWSAGAIVLVRVGLAALVVVPFGLVALRGRWELLRRNAGVIAVYGALAVAGAQFCYFSAVAHMQVGPALLIEYTAPAAVVVWLWLRHGQRPGAVTLVGAALAAAGLVLVLDLISGADLSVPGVLWALAAMVGAATYFVISADETNGLPPMVLAAAGLVQRTRKGQSVQYELAVDRVRMMCSDLVACFPCCCVMAPSDGKSAVQMLTIEKRPSGNVTNRKPKKRTKGAVR